MPASRSVASWCFVCALVLVAGTSLRAPVHAQAPAPAQTATAPRPAAAAPATGRTWASLTPAQQAALRPLQAEWGAIDPTRRTKWIEIADRLPTLPPDERARIQGRMVDWAALSPTQRGQARLNYKEAQRLPPEDRRARWEAYKSLPPDQQQALAARAAPASAPARKPRRDESKAKATLVPNTAQDTRPAAIAPSVAQAGPGATTNLVTKRPAPPAHQQPGLPKIPTSATFVDSRTLLPKRGAQAAATRTAAASAPVVLDRP